MKKLSRILIAGTMAAGLIAGLAACGGKQEPGRASHLKVGLILLHPAASSTYDKNFREAFEAAQKELGFQAVIKENIDEDDICQTTAEEMAEQGCNVIFADSFGHEDYMIAAAKNYPNTYFCHATGVKAATENLPNFFNAFASIYEGRYLAGVTAGLKLKALYGDDITDAEAKIGYVGAHPYAEVKSGYTSFYLGAKSVCPSVTMEVKFTNSWYDLEREETVANYLIKTRKCVLISQHADSMGAPNACEKAGVPNVTYNGSTNAACPNTYIVSSKIDWAPYFKYLINQRVKGEKLSYDWVGTLANGAVKLDAVGRNAASGTQAKIDEVKAKLEAGTIHVFDTNSFTVDSKKVTSYLADVDSDENYTGDTEVIKDGYFHESEFRSAPYFDLSIDGITNLGSDYKDK